MKYSHHAEIYEQVYLNKTLQFVQLQLPVLWITIKHNKLLSNTFTFWSQNCNNQVLALCYQQKKKKRMVNDHFFPPQGYIPFIYSMIGSILLSEKQIGHADINSSRMGLTMKLNHT